MFLGGVIEKSVYMLVAKNMHGSSHDLVHIRTVGWTVLVLL